MSEQSDRVCVVTMYKHGDHNEHSYVLGVWSDEDKARSAGLIEEVWRGKKYQHEITTWFVDANEYDNLNNKIGEQ